MIFSRFKMLNNSPSISCIQIYFLHRFPQFLFTPGSILICLPARNFVCLHKHFTHYQFFLRQNTFLGMGEIRKFPLLFIAMQVIDFVSRHKSSSNVGRTNYIRPPPEFFKLTLLSSCQNLFIFPTQASKSETAKARAKKCQLAGKVKWNDSARDTFNSEVAVFTRGPKVNFFFIEFVFNRNGHLTF